MAKLKMGLIGLGTRGSWHLKSILGLKDRIDRSFMRKYR